MPAASDIIPIFDDSNSEFRQLDATLVPVQGAAAFSGPAAAADEMQVFDASNSAYRTVSLRDVPINQAFGLDIFGNANLKHHVVTATLAEINAGHTLLTGVSGSTIFVHNVKILVNGTFITGTSVELEDDNLTPVIVVSFAQASLTNGAILEVADGTAGVGLITGLTADQSLVVTITGSLFAGGTSIVFSILYSIQ